MWLDIYFPGFILTHTSPGSFPSSYTGLHSVFHIVCASTTRPLTCSSLCLVGFPTTLSSPMPTRPSSRSVLGNLLLISIDKFHSFLYFLFTVFSSFSFLSISYCLIICVPSWTQFFWIWVDPWFWTFHKRLRSFWCRWDSDSSLFRYQLWDRTLVAVLLGLKIVEMSDHRINHSASSFASRKYVQMFFPGGFLLSHFKKSILDVQGWHR